MPQMSPMWWTFLFSTFILSFIMMWNIMYYQMSLNPSSPKSSDSKKNYLNWKW
uniref:ATP synthase complex subunit 8 n=1 Tax=Tapeinus singularis TaxID=1524541 RepID=A0A343W8S9_9HEMI|nr:ATP synthase F0 subunit 8 [Tapeinus singularis]AVZ00769.1 ATP synthase F0 subunit 8 [Tapeinus singularis]